MKELETNLSYNQIDKIIEILKGLPRDSVYLIGMAICSHAISPCFSISTFLSVKTELANLIAYVMLIKPFLRL